MASTFVVFQKNAETNFDTILNLRLMISTEKTTGFDLNFCILSFEHKMLKSIFFFLLWSE